jgi:hypothetical protein
MLPFVFRRARARTQQRVSPSRQRSFLPRLDLLEDRSVPSTLTVTNLNDTGVAGDGSLRGEIAAAIPGDTITFSPGLSGTIGLGSDLPLDRNLTILGNRDAGGNPLVALSRGGAVGSIDLTVNAGVTATVHGLGFTGATGHALVSQGSLTLDHVTVSGNRIGYYASGAYTQAFFGTVYNTGALTVQDSTISDNQVNGLAGWTGPNGGAGIWNTGTLTVLRTQLVNNLASGNNTNLGFSMGGAICNYGGTAAVTACTLTGNQASQGGGLCSVNAGGALATLAVSGCTVSGNSAAANGGGLYVSRAAQVTGCTITNNTALDTGGGVVCSGPALAVTLSGCTLAGNRVGDSRLASGEGGGLLVHFFTASTVRVTNCTIANNSAVGYAYNGQLHPGAGGGVYVLSLVRGPVLSVVASTVAGNRTDGAGGGLWAGPLGVTTLDSTLVAGNTAAAAPDVSGTLATASSYNLIGNGTGSTGLVNGTQGNQVGTSAAPIDPKLGPLQNNGGPAPTMALLAGSPARGAGDPALLGTADQRGVTRQVAVDVGAYQAGA